MGIKPQKATFREVEYEEKKFEKGIIYQRYVNGQRSKEVVEKRQEIIEEFLMDNVGFICKRIWFLRKIFYTIRYTGKNLWGWIYDKDIVRIVKRGIFKGKLIGTIVLESTKLQKWVTRIEFAIK